MTEYGLSVSLEGVTHRTPVSSGAAGGAADEFDGEYYCCAPPRPSSRMKLGDDIDDEGDGGDGGDSVESISPRVLFPEVDVRRRLDFSSLSLSPIVPRSSPPSPLPLPTTERILVCDDDCSSACCSVGDCGVCYMKLPLRSNHIFTMCGHLFCVRCLLKWWDTATTCPICRAELFQHEAVLPAVEAEAEAEEAEEAEVAVDAEIEPDNNGIRYDGGMVSSDSDSDSAVVEAEAPEADADAPEEEADEEVEEAPAVDLELWGEGRVPAYIHTYVRNIARGIRREHWYNRYDGGMVSSDSDSDSAIDLT